MTLDMGRLRELAAEFGFYPASVKPDGVERIRAELAEHDRWSEWAQASSLSADQLEHRYAHLRNRHAPTRRVDPEVRRHIEEIQAEQEALDAARHLPDGLPLRIADRYAAGRPRGEISSTGQGLHYYLLPKDDPVAALNILREAAGLELWPVLLNLDITPSQLHVTFASTEAPPGEEFCRKQ
jgi:hypothetical protein